MAEDLYGFFRENFPFAVREEETARRILSDPANTVFTEKNGEGKTIGACVLNKSTVYMIAVDKDFRGRGTGTRLLSLAEARAKASGYDRINIGVGDDYLMPGVPTSVKPYDEKLLPDALWPGLDDCAARFFAKRGYRHSWAEANCFDMRADLENVSFPDYSVGGSSQGVLYRWAEAEDIPAIVACVDDAEQSFTDYYRDRKLYIGGAQRVLIAVCGKEVAGALIVSFEAEGKGLGSVGCTAVANKFRGRHIGVGLVVAGTKYLKEYGLKNGFLGYTYSGLDKMYGYAGYRICVYYMMAEKTL